MCGKKVAEVSEMFEHDSELGGFLFFSQLPTLSDACVARENFFMCTSIISTYVQGFVMCAFYLGTHVNIFVL